jgi:hypothetical protein
MGNQVNICLATKSSIKGGGKRPWLSHKTSWTLGFSKSGILEVSSHGQRVLRLKNVHEMQVLKDPNIEISSVIEQAMKRLRFV